MSSKKEKLKKLMKGMVAGAVGTSMVSGALTGMDGDVAAIFGIMEAHATGEGTTTGTVEFDHERYTLFNQINKNAHYTQIDITVTDPDLNTDPGTQETVTVQVHSNSDSVTRNFPLVETGPDTGVFKAQSFGKLLNLTDEASYFDSKEGYYLHAEVNDIITVSYTDEADENGNTAVVTATAPIIPFTDGTVAIDADRYRPGDTLTITLEDADRNLDNTIRNTTGNAAGLDGFCYHVAVLEETGEDTGVFVGTVSIQDLLNWPGSESHPGIGTGSFYADVHDYNEAGQRNNLRSTPPATIIDYTAGTISLDAESYYLGSPVTITVTDEDMKRRIGSADTLTVKVSSYSDGTGIEVELTETGDDTGVFTGQVVTAGTSDQSAGQIRAAVGDPLTVTYDDIVSGGGTATRTATASIDPIPTTGTVTFDHERYTFYDEVYVTVTDADMNTNFTLFESVRAQVTSSSDSTGLEIMLHETGADTGVFFMENIGKGEYNPIRLISGPSYIDNKSGNIYLHAAAGDTITVTYNDASDANGNPTEVTAFAYIKPTVDGNIALDADRYRPGDEVTVTLTDDDYNLDTTNINSKSVRPKYSGVELDYKSLQETSVNTGIFSGTFSLTSLTVGGTPVSVSPGNGFNVIYTDRNAAGQQITRQATADIIDYSLGTVVLDADSYHPGSTVTITVTDEDMKRHISSPDTLTVQVTSDSDSTGIVVELTEAGNDTGIFTGQVVTAGTSDQSARQIKAVAGDTLTVTYEDAVDASGTTTARTYTADIATAAYNVSASENSTYSVSTVGGITTLTVKSGVSGPQNFQAALTPVRQHPGDEVTIFTHLRNGEMLGIQTTIADIDGGAGTAQANFDVQPGDIVRVYVADSLTTDPNTVPVILQE